MRGLIAACVAVFALAACDTPLTARDGASGAISAALGTPVMPLEGGVYRFVREGTPSEDSAAEAADAVVEGTDRPLFADVFVMQRHAASQSYVTSYGNLRLYLFEGDVLVMELYATDGQSLFFPARVDADGGQLIVYEYTCGVFSDAQRDTLGVMERCRVGDISAMRAGLGALDLTSLTALRFEWMQALPER